MSEGTEQLGIFVPEAAHSDRVADLLGFVTAALGKSIAVTSRAHTLAESRPAVLAESAQALGTLRRLAGELAQELGEEKWGKAPGTGHNGE